MAAFEGLRQNSEMMLARFPESEKKGPLTCHMPGGSLNILPHLVPVEQLIRAQIPRVQK